MCRVPLHVLTFLALASPLLAALQEHRTGGPAGEGLRAAPRGDLAVEWTVGTKPKEVRTILTLGNMGAEPIDWEISTDTDWLKIEPSSGTLQGGGRRRVDLTLDPFRTLSLLPGEHDATIRIENRTDGRGDSERRVVLLVRGDKGLSVGPFDEDRKGYCLTNEGRGAIGWRARIQSDHVAADPSEGELGPGESVFVSLVSEGSDPLEGRVGVLFLNETDGTGSTLRIVSAAGGELGEAPVPEAPALETSIERFGITWTFSDPVPTGRFVNGDPWVVGPVAIVEIDPRSVPIGRDHGRTMNGSMVNPSPQRGMTQGYDSATYGKYAGDDAYDPRLNVALGCSGRSPLVLGANTSLVSTISNPKPGMRPQLKTAAILTVLSEVPPPDAFRPPYTGSDKTIRHRAADLQRERLTQLPTVPGTPSFSEVEAMFERPWIDHVPLWYGRYIHPSENMPDYGREITDQVSTASLMLLINVPNEEKETLLVRFVQVGIDLFALLREGERWPPSAGHLNGRKWPILFAGLMLGDEDMKAIGREYGPEDFSEDGQTFLVDAPRPELGYTREMVGLPEWSAAHATRPELDDPRWDAKESFPPGATQVPLRTQNVKYRLCCSANAWWGELLAAYILGAKDLWNHEPLFLYQDRFLQENLARRITDYRLSWRPFYLAMWRRYRDAY
ncbi:MAG TPA: hypothetical protein ENJ09_13405 [Planctomycetes bacterium]|nr:hypothetical protein [Planctomycetota bacterium]